MVAYLLTVGFILTTGHISDQTDAALYSMGVIQYNLGDMFVVRNSGNMIPHANNYGRHLLGLLISSGSGIFFSPSGSILSTMRFYVTIHQGRANFSSLNSYPGF